MNPISKKLQNFKVVSAYMESGSGWKADIQDLTDYTYEEAARIAQDQARHLEAAHGNSHFWNVTLQNEAGQDYFQLFHGRLS